MVLCKTDLSLLLSSSNNPCLTHGDGVTAMVKELPQRRVGLRSPGLFPINCIQWLVQKQAQCCQKQCPGWQLKAQVEFSLENWLSTVLSCWIQSSESAVDSIGCLLSSWWIQSLKLAVKTVRMPFVIMMNSVFKPGCQQSVSFVIMLNSVFKPGCQQCQCLFSSCWIQSSKLAVNSVTVSVFCHHVEFSLQNWLSTESVSFVIMLNSVFKTGCQRYQCLLSLCWIQSSKLAVNGVSVFWHHVEFSL